MDAALSNQIPTLVATKPLMVSSTTSSNNNTMKPQPLSNPCNSIAPATVAVSNNSSSQCKSVRAASAFQNKYASAVTDVRKPAFKTHRKAATGYAAALLDDVCCDLINTGGALLSIVKDVRKVKMIAREVLEDKSIKEEKKGYMVRKVVERGNLHTKLAVVVKMLLAKGKVDAVEKVVDEFIRLWEDLCGIERAILVKKKKLHIMYDQ